MELIVPIAALKAVYVIYLTLLSHADEFSKVGVTEQNIF